MEAAQLQDRLSRGMGAAARVFGAQYDVLRPQDDAEPTRPALRVMRLHAGFDGGDPGYRRPRGYERALRGTFDSAYVRAGDYLAGPRGVLFVACLPPLQRPLCVLTNAVLDVLRPAGPDAPGLNPYGGVGAEGFATLLRGWPAQVLGAGSQAEHSMLLPLVPATIRDRVTIRGGDLLLDTAGRRFLATAAELTELGWRVSARLVGA